MATNTNGTSWLKQQAKKVSPGGPLASEVEMVSSQVERWLQGRQVDYAPPTMVPMALIDEKRSRNNQARATALVTDSVDRFATAMKQGAHFPPIVVFPQGGRLIIVDGNNRHAAAQRAGLSEIYGIVIAEDTPGELIHLLTVEANAHHGVTPELQWRLQQAFHLVSLGFTDALAAEVCSVTPTQIQHARRVQEADARARELKILGFSDLPATARAAMASVKDDAVFSRMARLAISSGMTIEEVRDMCRTVKAMGSESSRLNALELLAQERGIATATRRATGGKTPTRNSSAKQQLASSAGLLTRIEPEVLIKSIVTVNDRRIVEERLTALESKLKTLRAALTKVDVKDDE